LSKRLAKWRDVYPIARWKTLSSEFDLIKSTALIPRHRFLIPMDFGLRSTAGKWSEGLE
jgi:hypothetical protein